MSHTWPIFAACYSDDFVTCSAPTVSPQWVMHMGNSTHV